MVAANCVILHGVRSLAAPSLLALLALGCGRIKSSGALASEGGGGSTGAMSDTRPDAGPTKPSCTFKGFAPPAAYPTHGEGLAIAAVDRTHQGELDLVIGEVSDGIAETDWFVNTGNGVFAPSTSYEAAGFPARSVVAADFDGDRNVDVASAVDGAIQLDFGTASGFAAELVALPTAQTDGTLMTGDFDGDGHPDLVFAGFDYVESSGGGLPVPVPTHFTLSFYRNRGDGTFEAARASPIAEYFSTFATGDFDGDGLLDLAELTSAGLVAGVAFFRNAGDGTFASETYAVASDDWTGYGLGVADFDGDGRDDAATATILHASLPSSADVLAVFNGNRDGLAGPTDYPLVRTPGVYRLVTGDFNGDARPDLALVIDQDSQGARLEPTQILVFENAGDGSFGEPVTYTVGGGPEEYPTDFTAGDFNGDGVTDLAVTTASEAPPYPVALNVLLSDCSP